MQNPYPVHVLYGVHEMPEALLGGSWDLASRIMSTITGIIGNYQYAYVFYDPVIGSHEPSSKP